MEQLQVIAIPPPKPLKYKERMAEREGLSLVTSKTSNFN
jgi:hypothetical protein